MGIGRCEKYTNLHSSRRHMSEDYSYALRWDGSVEQVMCNFYWIFWIGRRLRFMLSITYQFWTWLAVGAILSPVHFLI